MIRKELNSQNQYEAGLALTSLSCYISTDLARDLSNDILTLVSFSDISVMLFDSIIFSIIKVIVKIISEFEYITYSISL